MANFASSPLGKIVGNIALSCGSRPSELAGYEGSQLEKLLFDAAVLHEVSVAVAEPQTTYEKIMQRRKLSGVYT